MCIDELEDWRKAQMTTEIVKHDPDYKPKAYKQYTIAELGQWVHLFAKRAEHRINPEKRAKDLYDAQNYLDMMQEALNDLKK